MTTEDILMRERDDARRVRDELSCQLLAINSIPAEQHCAELTKQRDQAISEVSRLTEELESHAFDLSPAMVQARNDQLNAEVERLKQELNIARCCKPSEFELLLSSERSARQELVHLRDQLGARSSEIAKLRVCFSEASHAAGHELVKAEIERDEYRAQVERLKSELHAALHGQ